MSAASVPMIQVSDRAIRLAKIFFASTSPLCAIAAATLAWRLACKLRRTSRLGLDDWFIVLAFCLSLADWILLCIPLAPYIANPPRRALTYQQSTSNTRLAFFAIIIWSFSMACVKVSVSLTLLRFLHGMHWRIFLYFLMIIPVLVAIADTLFLSLQCRPISRAWTVLSPKGTCLNPYSLRIISLSMAGMNIATDVILSLIPLAFLATLRRPLRERILIMILMATGFMASIASIQKTVIVLKYTDPKQERISLNIAVPNWTVAEEFVGVIAACMPTLKPVIQSLLAALGVSIGWDSEHGAHSSVWGSGTTSTTTTATTATTATNDEENRVNSLDDAEGKQREKHGGPEPSICSDPGETVCTVKRLARGWWWQRRAPR